MDFGNGLNLEYERKQVIILLPMYKKKELPF